MPAEYFQCAGHLKNADPRKVPARINLPASEVHDGNPVQPHLVLSPLLALVQRVAASAAAIPKPGDAPALITAQEFTLPANAAR